MVFEAEAGQQDRSLRGRCISVQLDQPGVNIPQFVRIFFGFRRLHQRRHFLMRVHDHIDQRRVGVFNVLSHHAETLALRQADGAGISMQLACDQLEKGGFSGTILPDQTDLPAIHDVHAGILDQRARSYFICQIVDGEHETLSFRLMVMA